MQWVLKFLRKRLQQEQDIADFHGSIAASGRKYAESARMARERIPQLQLAIRILTVNGLVVPPADQVKRCRSEKGNVVRRRTPKDRSSSQQSGQLSIF